MNTDEKDIIRSAAQIMGRKGGKVTSEAKAAAVRENGKKGGRPYRLKNDPSPLVELVGERYVTMVDGHTFGTNQHHRGFWMDGEMREKVRDRWFISDQAFRLHALRTYRELFGA